MTVSEFLQYLMGHEASQDLGRDLLQLVVTQRRMSPTAADQRRRAIPA